jgi:hypothetical protein
MRLISSRYNGKCRNCGKPHSAGTMVYWSKGTKGVLCSDCGRGNESKGNSQTPKTETKVKTTNAPALPTAAKAENEILRWSIDWSSLRAILKSFVNEGISPFTHSHGAETQKRHLLNAKEGGWEGFSASQVREWLNEGFDTSMLAGLGDFSPPLREKARFIFNEDGDEFHLDRALSGDDTYMSDWIKREAIPGLAFEANIMFNAGVNSKLVNAYNVWLCQAVYAIESAGIDSQITLRFPSRGAIAGDSRMAETVIRVKQENESVDFGAFSPMLSPAAFRGFGFAAMVLHAQARGKDISHGYGNGHSGNAWKIVWDAERRILFADCPYMPRSDEFPAEDMTRQLREALHAMHG